jgi:hypothetical protein
MSLLNVGCSLRDWAPADATLQAKTATKVNIFLIESSANA